MIQDRTGSRAHRRQLRFLVGVGVLLLGGIVWRLVDAPGVTGAAHGSEGLPVAGTEVDGKATSGSEARIDPPPSAEATAEGGAGKVPVRPTSTTRSDDSQGELASDGGSPIRSGGTRLIVLDERPRRLRPGLSAIAVDWPSAFSDDDWPPKPPNGLGPRPGPQPPVRCAAVRLGDGSLYVPWLGSAPISVAVSTASGETRAFEGVQASPPGAPAAEVEVVWRESTDVVLLGTVGLPDGNRAGGARILIRPWPRKLEAERLHPPLIPGFGTVEVAADEHGEFRVSGLNPGRHEILATAGDCVRWSQEVTLHAGVNPITVGLSAAAAFRVRLSYSGRPLPRVAVAVRQGQQLSAEVVTGPDGTALLCLERGLSSGDTLRARPRQRTHPFDLAGRGRTDPVAAALSLFIGSTGRCDPAASERVDIQPQLDRLLESERTAYEAWLGTALRHDPTAGGHPELARLIGASDLRGVWLWAFDRWLDGVELDPARK